MVNCRFPQWKRIREDYTALPRYRWTAGGALAVSQFHKGHRLRLGQEVFPLYILGRKSERLETGVRGKLRAEMRDMSVTETKVLTDRINRIEVSATMAITAEALKMEASGIDLANFGAGEPHSSTPRGRRARWSRR